MSDDAERYQEKSDADQPDRAVAKGEEQSDGWVTSLAWMPDGALLATGTTGGDARIVDAGSGEVRHHLALDGPVCALAWSSDGARLAVACTNGSAYIVDAGSGDVRHRLQPGTAGGREPTPSGIEHGEAQLQDLQGSIDQARAQTGEERQEQPEGPETADEGESEVPPPG